MPLWKKRRPLGATAGNDRHLSRRQVCDLAGRLILAGLLPACEITRQDPASRTTVGRAPSRLQWWTEVSTPARQAAAVSWNESRGPPILEVITQAALPSANSLAAAIAAGQPPSLLTLDSGDLTLLTLANEVQPLDGLARASRLDLKAFMPQALQPCYGLDDQLYALPEDLAITLLSFNRQFLHDAGVDYREAGLDFSQPHSTWESFRDLASSLARSSELQGWGFDPSDRFSTPRVWCWQNGGRIVSDDGRVATHTDPANVDALEWLTAWVRDQGGQGELADQQRTWGTNDAHPLLTGKLFAIHASNRFMDQLSHFSPDLPVNFAHLPVRRGGETPITQAAIQVLALAPGRHVELAWDVAQFLVAHATSGPRDRAAAAEAARNGWQWVPSYSGQLPLDRYRLAERPSGHTSLDEFNLHALEQARYARSAEKNPAPRIVAGSLRTAFRRAISGVATELQALRDAQQRAQQALDAVWASIAEGS